MKKPHVYEQTYNDYLARIARLDLKFLADKLDLQLSGKEVIIPFFGKLYRVSTKGVADPTGKQPHLSISVILCKYLLMCPMVVPLGGNWMSFKDFKDAAPLIQAFFNTVTLPIAESFSTRLADLECAAKKIGGFPPSDDFPYDLSLQFDALSKVPLLLLFNDKDEEFSAQCSVLFEKRVEKMLDMECLAMVGMLFCEYLKSGL
ncbi:hypothetical protein D1BOALGB6SA_7246 [Olavius sp. associated proteobacterium Delta 1]|nr:hypothetical protein D1BOALGB6SA_7246 [Olavius sp. associated proteobacterium Delta 1]